MPFIDSKITLKVSDEKKEAIKAKLGEAASIIGNEYLDPPNIINFFIIILPILFYIFY